MSIGRIGIVDDEPNIRHIVEAYIQREGFETVSLESAEEALAHWEKEDFDLWVIDIMLPNMDGYTLCRKIREKSEAPIIMISAKDEEIDKVLGLELGSDDYMTKPFSPRELVARIKRHLYKWQRYQTLETNQAILKVGELKMDTKFREVFWRGEKYFSTNKEFEVLCYFAEHVDHALSRESILHFVWGPNYIGSDRAVDDLVKRLRKKLSGIPIESIWGYGYRLKANEQS